MLAGSFINSAKSLPPDGIERATQGCSTHFLCLQSYAYPTELSWQMLIEGYLTLFVLVHLTSVDLNDLAEINKSMTI